MKEKIVIGIVGEKGSGKGTVAEHIKKKYQAEHFIVSDMLKKISRTIHLPKTRENLIQLALVLKKGFWSTILIDAMINNIKQTKSTIIIADGLRMPEDITPFKEAFWDNFHLFYVTAKPTIRYTRIKKRNEKKDEHKTTYEQFLRQERYPTEIAIQKTGEQADYKISNNYTLNELYNKVDLKLKRILSKKR